MWTETRWFSFFSLFAELLSKTNQEDSPKIETKNKIIFTLWFFEDRLRCVFFLLLLLLWCLAVKKEKKNGEPEDVRHLLPANVSPKRRRLFLKKWPSYGEKKPLLLFLCFLLSTFPLRPVSLLEQTFGVIAALCGWGDAAGIKLQLTGSGCEHLWSINRLLPAPWTSPKCDYIPARRSWGQNTDAPPLYIHLLTFLWEFLFISLFKLLQIDIGFSWMWRSEHKTPLEI